MRCLKCEALCCDQVSWGCLALGFKPRQMRDGSWGCSRSEELIRDKMQVWRILTPRAVKEQYRFLYPKKQPNEDKLENAPVSLFKTLREKQILRERAEKAEARRRKYAEIAKQKRAEAKAAREAERDREK